MNVIDQILNEWSFRCHDGIVDMNDPTKLSILNEILAEYNLNEQEKQNISSDYLEKILLSKNIPEQLTDYIVLKADKLNQIKDLYDLINSVSLNELRGKDTTLQVGNLSWLNNVIGITSKSLTIGKGEILLAIMIKEAKLDLSDIKNKNNKDIADLNVSGRKVEIKQSSETGGAIISKAGRGAEYNKLREFQEKWQIKGKLTTWTSIYDKISLLDAESRIECINDLNDSLGFSGEESFKSSDFGNNETVSQNKEDFSKFCKKAAYLFVGDYLNNKDLILMNNNLDYIVLNDKEQILTNPNIRFNSHFIPRAFYKETPLKESSKLAEEELEEE